MAENEENVCDGLSRQRRVLGDITNQQNKRGFTSMELGDGLVRNFGGENVGGVFDKKVCTGGERLVTGKSGQGGSEKEMGVLNCKEVRVGSLFSDRKQGLKEKLIARVGSSPRAEGNEKELAVWNGNWGKNGSLVLDPKGLMERSDMDVTYNCARRVEKKLGILDVGDESRDSCISSDVVAANSRMLDKDCYITGGRFQNESGIISRNAARSNVILRGLSAQVSCNDVGFSMYNSSKYGPAEKPMLPMDQGSRGFDLENFSSLKNDRVNVSAGENPYSRQRMLQGSRGIQSEKCLSTKEVCVNTNLSGNLVLGQSMLQGSGGIESKKLPPLQKGSVNVNACDDLFLGQPMVQGSRGLELEKCSSVREGCGNVNASGNLPLSQPLVLASTNFGLEKCSSRNKGFVNLEAGDDIIKSCTCLFCLKASYIWANLHYQDIKGRMAALSKSQKEVGKLVHKFSKGKEDGQGNSSKSSELESDLSSQWKSLFINMGKMLQQESNHLKGGYVALKDLKENCKKDLETVNGIFSDKI